MPKTWFKILNAGSDADPAEVMVYDDIGYWGIRAKDFAEAFNAIKAKKINVRINSGGGDFFDGCAIHSIIKDHAAEVTCHVDGLAASAASVVAIAGDKVCVGRNSFMMIHNVMSMAMGNAADLRKEVDLLDKLSSSTAALYATCTGKSSEEMQKLMDAETWFTADEAVEMGLADEVKDPDGDEDDDEEELNQKNQSFLRAMSKYQRVPEQLRRFAASLTGPKAHAEPQRRREGENKPMAQKIIVRDGKHFVNIDGKEIEVEGSVPVNAGPSQADLDKAKSEAAKAAVEQERAYRAMFNTVVASAGLDAKGAEKFEKDFYGRSEADLKFLASHAIDRRATPVGEGSGNPEPTPGQQDAGKKAEAEIRTYCEKRLKGDKTLRKAFRANTANPSDPSFKNALERYIEVETKCRQDQAAPAKASETEPTDDPVARVFKNKKIIQYV